MGANSQLLGHDAILSSIRHTPCAVWYFQYPAHAVCRLSFYSIRHTPCAVWYFMETIGKRHTSCAGYLTSAHQGDNFHPIALGQPMFGVTLARDQFKIDFDGHRPATKPKFVQQSGDCRAVGHLTRLAVECKLHGCLWGVAVRPKFSGQQTGQGVSLLSCSGRACPPATRRWWNVTFHPVMSIPPITIVGESSASRIGVWLRRRWAGGFRWSSGGS